jgi:hypothetical protein
MKITKKWLMDNRACVKGVTWFKNQAETDIFKIIKNLMNEDHFDWSKWVISRALNFNNKIKYAIFSAESVLDIFEKEYPDDSRPRIAIEAAKNYLKLKTKDAADAASYAAYAASYAAYAAADAAADAASYAAYAAAYAAYAAHAASNSANSASNSANSAVYAAANAAYASDADKLKTKIIQFGCKLLKNQEEKNKCSSQK